MSGSRCQCGFVFDGSATTGTFEALEIDLQEAEVYAEYLQVRMLQAKEVAEVAIADEARTPGDAAKTSIAAEANAEFKASKSEYDQQMALVAQLRRDARTTQDAETSKAQAAAWSKAEQLARARRAEQKTPPARQISKPGKIQSGSGKHAAKPARPAPIPPKPAASASKAAAGQPSPTPAMREKMATAANSAAQRSRQQQAAKKPAAVQAKKVDPANQVAKPAPVQPPRKPAPAVQSKPVPRPATNEKECPNCTALVAMKARECKCGFTFVVGASQMDGIGLSEEDRALLNMFQPGSNR